MSYISGKSLEEWLEEQRRQRAEEKRREEAQKKAEAEQKTQQSTAATNVSQPSWLMSNSTKTTPVTTIKPPYTNTKASPKTTDAKNTKDSTKSANTFYTTKPNNDTIVPRFNSVAAYEDEIARQQKALDAMHGQQFKLMIQNNTKGMAALDAPIKAAQEAIDDLTTEMYAGMGAYEHGKKGNQLLDDDKWSGYTPEENKATPNMGDKSPTGNAEKPGLHLTNSKPQFAADDTPAHVTGLDDTLNGSANGTNGSTASGSYSGSDYISEKDFNTQLADMESQLGVREKLASGYNDQMTASSFYDPDYSSYQEGYVRNLEETVTLKEQIKALKEQRTWSEKYEIVKDDPLFNTTGFVNDQIALGQVAPFGSKGNASDSCCGSIAAQNINQLFGENSNFADVYTYFNDDSKLLDGGKLGVNPIALTHYLEDKGHQVSIEGANADSLKAPGKFIYVYMWYTQADGWGAHYMAGENTGTSIEVYNPYNPESTANDMQNYFDADLSMVTFKDNYDPMQKIKKWIPFYDDILPQDDGVGFVMRVD